MGRVRARLLFALYRRKLLQAVQAGGTGRRPFAPCVPVAPLVQPQAWSLTVGSVPSAGLAVGAMARWEEQLPHLDVAVRHYFSAVARAWVGDPLGRVMQGPAVVPPLCTGVGDLVRSACHDAVPVAYTSLAGQWLPFVQATGWQPGVLLEDRRDVFSFWLVHGRMVGQSRVSQVLAGYYLSMLQARFRCRVGVHIGCAPAVRRGDAAFVRLSMSRWRWTSCWGGSRGLMAGALLCVLLCLRACDARGLARAVRFLLVCAGYFRHRALLVFLQRFLAASLDFVGLSSDVRGVLLQLRGKIGRRGLARKSKYVITCGLPRPTGGSLCILWDYTQATTITGVLGLNVALVF